MKLINKAWRYDGAKTAYSPAPRPVLHSPARGSTTRTSWREAFLRPAHAMRSVGTTR